MIACYLFLQPPSPHYLTYSLLWPIHSSHTCIDPLTQGTTTCKLQPQYPLPPIPQPLSPPSCARALTTSSGEVNISVALTAGMGNLRKGIAQTVIIIYRGVVTQGALFLKWSEGIQKQPLVGTSVLYT